MRRALLAPFLLLAAAPSPNAWLVTWSLRPPAGEAPETPFYSDAGEGAMRMVVRTSLS